MPKERIVFVDTLKGICIILVVLMHCGIPADVDNGITRHISDALRTFRMPTYYFLSGIFFKTYSGLNDFSRRKINNIIIPLLFFYVLNVVGSVLATVLICLTSGQHFEFNWSVIFDIFYRSEWRLQTVIPLWFLFSLFWANLIFYILKSRLGDLAVFATVLFLAIVGFILESHKVKLPWYVISSLIGLPYFVLGFYIKQFGCLQSRAVHWFGFLQFIVVAIVVVLFAKDYTKVDTIGNFLLYRYCIPFASVLSLFWLCKCIPYRIPVVTFLGRYSLIVLGTHMFLISYLYLIPMRVLDIDNKWLLRIILFFIVIALELVIVPFLRDKFPRFTAQKEFFMAGWKTSVEK